MEDEVIWKKPEPNKVFWDGEIFVVAVLIINTNNHKSKYHCYVIRSICDSETPVSFVIHSSDEEFCWTWEDVDLYISINHDEVSE